MQWKTVPEPPRGPVGQRGMNGPTAIHPPAQVDPDRPPDLVDRCLRHRARRYLQRRVLQAGRRLHVLNLGCGLGDDAQWMTSLGHRVLAVDCEEYFVAQATERARTAQNEEDLQFAHIDLHSFSPDDYPTEFDLLFFSRGISHLVDAVAARRLGVAASGWLRPGGRVFLAAASRREATIQSRRTDQSIVSAWHPHEVVDAFSPAFSIVRLAALAVVMPDSDQSGGWRRHRLGVSCFDALDRFLTSVPGAHHFARSLIVDLEKSTARTVRSRSRRRSWARNAPAPAASFQATPGSRGAVARQGQEGP